MSRSIDQREPIEALAEEFMERKRRGEQPTLEEYATRHPELADEIRDLFPALVMMENLGNVSSDATGAITGPLGRVSGMNIEKLGDYRILREIGRGGMGVVFEAEQESLGRRVALKVLSSSAVVDVKQVRRFEREAKSAARLHHTNIVPVFGVGHQDGHYYYVMQFIQGQSLDLVLDELRRLKKPKSSSTTLPNAAGARRSSQPDGISSRLRSTVPDELSLTAADVANSLLNGRFAEMNLLAPGLSRTEGKEGVTEGQQGATEAPAADAFSPTLPERSTAPAAPSHAVMSHLSLSGHPGSISGSALSLSGSTDRSSLSEADRHFFRGVARLGVQVAEALDYANNQGVLHRDIKPSNLLLDTKGNVWVTDFGLAKASDAEDLTHTGDILGTIRYMAPERFQGKCDVRSDIYALGLTLYEVASLQPAYDGSERHKLMDRVLHEEPVRLRKLATNIPRDLETIIHKAMSREPAERYPSAAAMGEDLHRFLSDKPIKARHVTSTERIIRWSRRNPALAALSAGLVVLLLGTAVASTLAAARFRSMADQERQTRREAEAALQREGDQRRRTAAALQATEAAEKKESEARRRAETNEQEAVRQQSEAVRQQKMAEANFQLARHAVDDYLTRVSENRLLRVAGLQPLRKELLESALSYYQGFLNQRKDDPALQKDMALAYSRIAGITAEIGSKPEAATLLDRSLEIRKRLQGADPRNQVLKLDLVDHYLSAAPLQRQLGEFEAAKKSCHEAYSILIGISPQDPDRHAMIQTAGGTALGVAAHQSSDPEILDRFARVLNEEGTVADESGHPTDALSAYAQAIYVLQSLVSKHGSHPRGTQFRHQLANQWNRLGATEGSLGLTGEALAAHEEALKSLGGLAKDSPAYAQIADFQRELATTHEKIGDIQAETGKTSEAVQAYRQALSVRRKLARENPSITDDQRDLAKTWLVQATMQEKAGDLTGALGSARQAVQRQGLLVEMAPSEKVYARVLGQYQGYLASLLRRSKQPAEALAVYRQATESLGQLPPQTSDDFQDLAFWHAACVHLIGAVDSKPNADGQALKNKEADLALANLAKAVGAGFNDIDRIKKNPDLEPLSMRPEFKKLVDELEKKRKVLVWNHDLEAAKAQAAQEKKDLFLYFGGSDWCPYDSAMRKSHLSTDAFRDYALQHFVIVEFDDPQRKAKPANHPTRLKLQGPWSINACPTTVLADARGRRYAQLAGALRIPTADYLKELDKLRKAHLTRDEFLLKAARDRGVEKARLLDQALGAMSEDVLTSYADEVREILKLDPADHGGFRAKYLDQEGRVRLNEADQLADKKDWSGVLRVLNEDFEKLQCTGDVARDSFYFRGMANASLNQVEAAVADYERFLTDPKVHPVFRYQEAMLLLETGRPDEYRAAVQRLLDLFGRNENIPLIMPVLQASRLADDGVADYDPLIKIAAKLVETNKDKFPFVRTHGHLLYRGRHYREAIERLEEALKLGKETHPFLVPDRFFVAMAHHRLGHAEEARQWLGRAEKAMHTLMADPKVDDIFKAVGAENNWQNRLVAELIRTEANALIKGAAEARDPAADLALARAHVRLRQWEKAAVAYDRAIERQPANPHLRLERAGCHIALHQDEQAKLELARAGELAPGDLRLIHERGRIYADWGRWDEAAADFTRAIAGVPDGRAQATILTPIWQELLRWDPVFIRVAELRPEDHVPWVTRGNARARRADWRGAAADFAKAIALRPEKHPLWYQQTMLLLACGDEPGYRKHCRNMLDRFGATQDPVIAERTAKSFLLLPCGTEQLHAAASLAETALARGAGHKYLPFFELAKGLVEYREGSFAAAEQRLGKLLADGNPDWNLAPPAYLILAMAQHRLGQAAKAGESLNRAIKIVDQQVPDLARAEDSWHGWLLNKIIRSEAEALIVFDPIFPTNPFVP